jgi:NitT/TauT family transport system substrate-binding protein
MRSFSSSVSIAVMFALAFVLALAGAGVRARAQPAPIVLRIATPGNDGNALAYYALELGIFRKYGLLGRIETMRAGSGSGIAAAVTGGAIDIGEGDIVAVAAAREHGIPLTLIAPSFLHRGPAPTSAIIVAKTSPVRSGKDLDGKTIAVPSLSGPAKVATARWIEKNGGSLATIKFVEMPQTAMAAAVARGTVAAASTTEPNLSAALDDARVLGYYYDAIGNPIQVTAWFATEDWVRANADAARRFASAMHEAALWGNNPQNHAASGAILAKYTPFPAELLAKMHRASYGESFDPALMQPVLDASFEEKSLAKRVAARDLLSPVALTR